MNYMLVLQNHVDGLVGESWPISPPCTVGRDANCDLMLEHDSISRKHCQFTLDGEGALTVKDLDSMNGTYVNDRRVQKVVLMPGQVVQIGALMLQVEFTTGVGASQAASHRKASPQSAGSMYQTRPMETFKPVELPPEKSWWQKLLGR